MGRSWTRGTLRPDRTSRYTRLRQLTVRITQRKRKKRERLLRGVSLGLHQDLRRAETETGIETDLVRRKGPNPGLAPGPGKERRKATRETDRETETGHETDTTETDITETGETTDVTGTRTTLTSCDDTKRIPAGTRNTAGDLGADHERVGSGTGRHL